MYVIYIFLIFLTINLKGQHFVFYSEYTDDYILEIDNTPTKINNTQSYISTLSLMPYKVKVYNSKGDSITRIITPYDKKHIVYAIYKNQDNKLMLGFRGTYNSLAELVSIIKISTPINITSSKSKSSTYTQQNNSQKTEILDSMFQDFVSRENLIINDIALKQSEEMLETQKKDSLWILYQKQKIKEMKKNISVLE